MHMDGSENDQSAVWLRVSGTWLRGRKFPSRRWIAATLVALFCWTLHVRFASGEDFFRAYSWLVLEPTRYAGDYGIFSPPWLAPIMAPFVTMPGRAGFALFTAATLGMLLYSSRILGGRAIPLLLSAQVAWVLWWGQIDGLAILGVALAVTAEKKRSVWLMFAALLLASAKPQVGLVPAVAQWWWLGKGRWKTLAAFAVIFLASLLVWGCWPMRIMEQIVGLTDARSYGPWNTSLGLIALPLFIPALLAPLERRQRLIAITATALLVSPYMPYYSTVILLCFPVPWWAYLFGFLGYLPNVIGTQLAWNGIILLPVTVLFWVYVPLIQAWFSRRSRELA